VEAVAEQALFAFHLIRQIESGPRTLQGWPGTY